MDVFVAGPPPPVVDYTHIYEPIMQFNKNKTAFIHQWYSFVEGYSKEFIQSILAELEYQPKHALDPFAGSGTTPVELQSMDIRCSSFEVSPFMHMLALAKLDSKYTMLKLNREYERVSVFLRGDILAIRKLMQPPVAKTFQPRKNMKKWVFNRGVMDGILDVKYAISLIQDSSYQRLSRVALASILLDVSNVYRNGKCLSYKKNWQDTHIKRREVHEKFLEKLDKIRMDVAILEGVRPTVDNSKLCYYGDVRKKIDVIPDNSIDLVITSPPYLNSRDYTDMYIAELWTLDLVNSYEELRELRNRTLRSHVQVRYDKVELLQTPLLANAISEIESHELWNKDIPNMIKAYFLDMDELFSKLILKMVPGKKVYFNVANSAYYGVRIDVDEIVSNIASSHGFKIEEIREARKLRPSSQQKDQIDSLRESVIVMTS